MIIRSLEIKNANSPYNPNQLAFLVKAVSESVESINPASHCPNRSEDWVENRVEELVSGGNNNQR